MVKHTFAKLILHMSMSYFLGQRLQKKAYNYLRKTYHLNDNDLKELKNKVIILDELLKKKNFQIKSLKTNGGEFPLPKLDPSPMEKIRDFFNFKKFADKFWDRLVKNMIRIDVYLPIPIFNSLIPVFTEVLNIRYGSVSILLTESLPRTFLNKNDQLEIELESEFTNLVEQFQDGLKPQNACDEDLLYLYLIGGKNNYQIERLEGKIRKSTNCF